MSRTVIDFNPRAPCGARPGHRFKITVRVQFQPTRPLRGATSGKVVYYPQVRISTHAPLAGRDQNGLTSVIRCRISTHAPLAGRDVNVLTIVSKTNKISTHAPLAGRDSPCSCSPSWSRISTHAPLAGRDSGKVVYHPQVCISTHAPLAGRDSKSVQITMHIFAITDKFQMLLRKMPTVRAFCFFFVREKRANFSANRPDNFCTLVLRTIRSSVPRADTSACSRSVRFYSRTSCPSSKIEGCPFLGQ